MIKDIQFPAKYYEKNILFNQNNEAWAYYEITGYEYDYLSENKKASIASRLETIFAQVGVDTHLLVLPKFHSVQEIHDQFKTTIKGPLKEEAIRHIEEAAPLVEEAVDTEAGDDHFYFGVKLPNSEDMTLTFKNIKDEFKKVLNDIFSSIGIDDKDIQESDFEQAARQERIIFKFINTHILARKVNESDFQWLIRRNFFRGIDTPPLIKDFKPTYQKTKKGRRPASLLTLTEGIVDTVTEPRKILLSQAIDGEIKTGHVAFLTVSYIPTDGLYNFGTEWIYASQSLDFPIETSIRTETLEHRKVSTMVMNKKKELKDQDQHAASTANETTFEVTENVQLAKELETFTKVTKMPQIYVSIVFCVSGSNNDQLKSRVRALKDLYSDFKFQLEQPISDQFKLFNEFIPGAKRYVSSYIQMMEPAALAAGMFGATTQLGDGKGFPIGITGDKRAIYLNPRLYTQGIEGARSRSLSSVFIGSKGSGKSFGANLITYLSVLAGAKALIVDPKGDRTNFKKDLLDIGHEVNVITLEANPENKGRLDPFKICKDIKEAEELAISICVYLSKINAQKEREEWIAITNAVKNVAREPKPCMDKVIKKLLAYSKKEAGYNIGAYLATYQDLSFASLLFGDGTEIDALNLDYAMNVIQIQNFKMPTANKKAEDFNMEEMLSMAMMIPIGEFSLNFMHQDRSIMKIVFIDESWFLEKTDIGKDIIDRLQREGRSWNAGVYRASQAIKDVDDETKSLIGLKFIFQNSDPDEAANSLKFLGIDPTAQLIEQVQNLAIGECLMQDIYGRTGTVHLVAWFQDIADAFDTRPPIDKEPEPQTEPELAHV